MGRGETGWSQQGSDLLTRIAMENIEGFKQGRAELWLLSLKDRSSCWLQSRLEGQEGAEEGRQVRELLQKGRQ